MKKIVPCWYYAIISNFLKLTSNCFISFAISNISLRPLTFVCATSLRFASNFTQAAQFITQSTFFVSSFLSNLLKPTPGSDMSPFTTAICFLKSGFFVFKTAKAYNYKNYIEQWKKKYEQLTRLARSFSKRASLETPFFGLNRIYTLLTSEHVRSNFSNISFPK